MSRCAPVFVVSMWVALLANPWLRAEEPHLKNPVVFQRQELNPTTGATIHAGKLWIMEADGSQVRQITFGHTYDEHASLYGDQEHALYAEFFANAFDVSRGARLVKLDIYTGEREIVGEEPGCSWHHASISPIDDLITYHRHCGEREALWLGLGDATVEVPMRLTNGVQTRDGVIGMHEKGPPSLAQREVALVHVSGHGAGAVAHFLTDDSVLHRRPAISPDGKLMAWQTNLDSSGDEIYIANIDGANPRNLTQTMGNDGHPWFSRDGKWIVFESDRSGNWEIWRMRADGSAQEQLTEGKGQYVSTRARM